MCKNTLERLFPGLDADALAQAKFWVRAGGFGFRPAAQTTLAAAIASKLAAEPKVCDIVARLVRVGIMRDGAAGGQIQRWSQQGSGEVQGQFGR